MIADDDPNLGDDKNSVTADQLHAGVAYQVWDRLDTSGGGFDGPALISVTHDHGRTWSKPAKLVDTAAVAPFTQTIGNIVVEDAHGKLYDFFNLLTFPDATANVPLSATYAMVTSTDEGRTWSRPTPVATDSSVAEVDPNAPGKVLRAGGGLEAVAVDPVSGRIWMTYEGSDFSGGSLRPDRDGVLRRRRRDMDGAGAGEQAGRARVHAGGRGGSPGHGLGLVLRPAVSARPGHHDAADRPVPEGAAGGDQLRTAERQITPQFDWLLAPFAGGYMLGDYEGMAPAGAFGVQTVFVASLNPPTGPTDVYSGVFVGPFDAAGGDGGTRRAGGAALGAVAPRFPESAR